MRWSELAKAFGVAHLVLVRCSGAIVALSLLMRSGRIALVSYWALFIVGPTFVIALWLIMLGHSILSAVVSSPLLLLFMVLGERGLRVWNRLWRIHQ
jgi:hypothetical protein